MADEKTVTVDLKRTYTKGGKRYGPGEKVEMPHSLAFALGLSPEQRKAAAPKKGKKS
jgi:hypothetical protein